MDGAQRASEWEIEIDRERAFGCIRVEGYLFKWNLTKKHVTIQMHTII